MTVLKNFLMLLKIGMKHHLNKKIEKGTATLSNNTIEDPNSKELLALQIMAMNLYEDTLDRRISYEILKLSAPVCDCCKK